MTVMALDLIAELHKIKKAVIQAQAARDAGGKGSGMICSIGYQKLDQKTLIEILKARQVETLVDVRSRSYGRKPVFNRNAMQRWLPPASATYGRATSWAASRP
jgi:hypothetical protein